MQFQLELDFVFSRILVLAKFDSKQTDGVT